MVGSVPESDLFSHFILAIFQLHHVLRRPHHLSPKLPVLLKLWQGHLLKEGSSVQIDPMLFICNQAVEICNQVVEETLQPGILTLVETLVL